MDSQKQEISSVVAQLGKAVSAKKQELQNVTIEKELAEKAIQRTNEERTTVQQEKGVLLASNQNLRMENSRLESYKDRLRMETHDLKQKQLQLQTDNEELEQRHGDLQYTNSELKNVNDQLSEPGAFASAKSFRDKVVMPFMNKLKTLIKNLTIQCVRLKEEVIQLRKEKKRLSDDVEFFKGKIKDMSDRTELLQEKADDLERVKRYAGAEQIDTIIRKVREQERAEQQIRRYDRSYGTR